jgi:hypothetical protein
MLTHGRLPWRAGTLSCGVGSPCRTEPSNCFTIFCRPCAQRLTAPRPPNSALVHRPAYARAGFGYAPRFAVQRHPPVTQAPSRVAIHAPRGAKRDTVTPDRVAVVEQRVQQRWCRCRCRCRRQGQPFGREDQFHYPRCDRGDRTTSWRRCRCVTPVYEVRTSFLSALFQFNYRPRNYSVICRFRAQSFGRSPTG